MPTNEITASAAGAPSNVLFQAGRHHIKSNEPVITEEHEHTSNFIQQQNTGVDLCTVCLGDFYSDDYECVECTGCLLWCHLCCIELTKEEYDNLEGEQWHCPSCVQSRLSNFDSSTLPGFVHCRDIGSVVWGELKGEEVANEINKAYITVLKWKKNLFKLPGGKCGNSFVSEIGKLGT